jgi:hypothetical protein
MSRTFLIPLVPSDANEDKILSMAKRAINQWEKESAIVLSTTGVEDLLPYQIYLLLLLLGRKPMQRTALD